MPQRGVRLRGRTIIERRKHPRLRVAVPVELHAENSTAPLRCVTSDLSLDGCYLESVYPFPTGTCLDLNLEAGETLLISAKVVACDPQFGSGIYFVRMLEEDRAALQNFLDHVANRDLAH